MKYEPLQKVYPESGIRKRMDCNVLGPEKRMDSLWALTYEDRELRLWDKFV